MSHTTQQPDEPGTDESRSDELESLRAEMDEMRHQMAEMAAEMSELRAERDELRAELETQSDRIEWQDEARNMSSLWIDGIPVGRAITKRREEIEELRAECAEPSETAETELEVALSLPAESRDRYGVSEQRAIVVARYLRSGGGDQGARVNTDLKRAVERERDEDLAWQQLYRACEVLESLSGGAIVFVDDDGSSYKLHVDDGSVLA